MAHSSLAPPAEAKPARPRGRLGRLVGLLAVLLLGGGAGAYVGSRGRDTRETLPEAGPPPPAATAVTVGPVAFRPVQRRVEAVGTLHGFEEVTLFAKVEGRVRRLLHDVADRVAPGELLLEIDPTDADLAVRQAEKALLVELAKLGLTEVPTADFDIAKLPVVLQASIRHDNAKQRLERAQAARTAMAREDLADRLVDVRIAEAEYQNQLLQARAGLAMAQMKQETLAIARQQRKDTEVRVPTPTLPLPNGAGVSYLVAQRHVAEGTMVRQGAELGKLVINQMLKLRVPVPERYSADVKVGQPAEVQTAAFAKPFLGKATRLNPAVDSATRTFEVEIQVANPNGDLKCGSFAKASILTRLDAEAPTVPLAALVQFAGITKIFLIENDKAKEVPVTTGVQTTEWVEIVEPRLPRGARVVVSGQRELADGTAVVVRTETAKEGGQ